MIVSLTIIPPIASHVHNNSHAQELTRDIYDFYSLSLSLDIYIYIALLFVWPGIIQVSIVQCMYSDHTNWSTSLPARSLSLYIYIYMYIACLQKSKHFPIGNVVWYCVALRLVFLQRLHNCLSAVIAMNIICVCLSSFCHVLFHVLHQLGELGRFVITCIIL